MLLTKTNIINKLKRISDLKNYGIKVCNIEYKKDNNILTTLIPINGGVIEAYVSYKDDTIKELEIVKEHTGTEIIQKEITNMIKKKEMISELLHKPFYYISVTYNPYETPSSSSTHRTTKYIKNEKHKIDWVDGNNKSEFETYEEAEKHFVDIIMNTQKFKQHYNGSHKVDVKIHKEDETIVREITIHNH